MTGIFQSSFSGGIIGPGLAARPDVSKYQSGVQDAVNMTIRVHGGMQNRAGTLFMPQYAPGPATKPATHPVTVSFEFSVDTTYILHFDDFVLRVVRDGGYILDGSFAATTITDVTTAAEAELVMASSTEAATWAAGDWLFITLSGHPLDGSIVEVSGVSGANVKFRVIRGEFLDTTDTGLWPSPSTDGTAKKVYTVASPFAIEDLPDLRMVRDLNTVFFAHENYAPRKLVRVAEDDWQFSAVSFTPVIPKPTSVTATATTGSGSDTHTYVVSAVAEDTGEESLPSAEASVDNDLTTVGNENTVSWDAVTGARRYIVYKEVNGVFGFIGGSNGLDFVDDNIAPDTSDSPQGARDPFPTSDDWPRVVFFHEQRLGYASTKNNPLLIEMSQSTQFTNFNRSLPPKDNEAISFRLRAAKRNRIVAVRPAQELLVFTTGGEWSILGGDNQDFLTPRNPRPQLLSSHGSAVQPEAMAVGEVSLFVSDGGASVRDMVAGRDIPSSEVSLLVKDLLEDRRVRAWDYAQQPDKLIWAALEDGSLWSLAYMLGQEIWGWTRHEIGGPEAEVLWVSVIREGRRDTPYLTIRRLIDGHYVTTLERFDPRQAVTAKSGYFVDGGMREDAEDANATAVGGLLHLRGETVAVLNGGNVIEGAVVDPAGFVELGVPVDYPRVGYPYVSEFTTLPIEIESQDQGSMWGRMKTFSTVSISVLETRGIAVAVAGVGVFNEFKEWTPSLGTTNIPLFTGLRRFAVDSDWQPDLRLRVRQRFPLPMTVLGLSPDWEFGE